MAQPAIDRLIVNPPCEEPVGSATTARCACSTSCRAAGPARRAGFLTRLKGSFMADKGSLSRIASPPSCGAAIAAFTGRS